MIRQIIGEVSVPVANTEVQQVIENPGIVKTYLEKYMPSVAYQLSRAACCCDSDTAYRY